MLFFSLCFSVSSSLAELDVATSTSSSTSSSSTFFLLPLPLSVPALPPPPPHEHGLPDPATVPQHQPQRQAQQGDDEEQCEGGDQEQKGQDRDEDAAARARQRAQQPPRGPHRLRLPVRERLAAAALSGVAALLAAALRLGVLHVEVEDPPLDRVRQNVDRRVDGRGGVGRPRVARVLVRVDEPAEGAVRPLDVVGGRLFFLLKKGK